MDASRALARAAERVLPLLPRSARDPIAEVVGTAAFLAAPRARAAVSANLAVVAPLRAPSVRRIFANQVRQYLEVFHIPRVEREELEASLRVEGWESFTCAHALGKGVIFATAHLGPIALVGQILLTRGYELTLPVERTDSEFMHAVNRARQAQGLRLVPMDAAFSIGRTLRRGGVLGFVADRAVSGVGERVEFCGRQALLPSAHIALALRTGAALVPAFAWHEEGKLVAHIEEPVELRKTGDREADVRDGVRRFALILERFVRAHPDEWTIFEPVWDAR